MNRETGALGIGLLFGLMVLVSICLLIAEGICQDAWLGPVGPVLEDGFQVWTEGGYYAITEPTDTITVVVEMNYEGSGYVENSISTDFNISPCSTCGNLSIGPERGEARALRAMVRDVPAEQRAYLLAMHGYDVTFDGIVTLMNGQKYDSINFRWV